MLEAVTDELRFLTLTLEAIGAFALILGFVIATARCVLEISRMGATEAIEGYRQAIGRVVLIGLEILVAATIIKTITFDPTLENMGLLAHGCYSNGDSLVDGSRNERLLAVAKKKRLKRGGTAGPSH